MHKIVHTILYISLIISCGETDSKNHQKESNDVAAQPAKVVVTPLGGTFEHYVWVKFSEIDDEGFLYAKSPGSDEFDLVSHCSSSLFPNAKNGDRCIEVTETGSLSFYFDEFISKSEIVDVDFTIETKQSNLKIREIKTDTLVVIKESETQLFEEETVCRINDDGRMFVSIKTTDPKTLGADKVAFVVFSVDRPRVGQTTNIVQADDRNVVGIQIESVFDTTPAIHGSILASYTSARPDVYRGKIPFVSCDVGFESLDKDSVVKGSISCSGMGNYLIDPERSKIPYGKTISFDGKWQCDRFDYYFAI